MCLRTSGGYRPAFNNTIERQKDCLTVIPTLPIDKKNDVKTNQVKNATPAAQIPTTDELREIMKASNINAAKAIVMSPVINPQQTEQIVEVSQSSKTDGEEIETQPQESEEPIFQIPEEIVFGEPILEEPILKRAEEAKKPITIDDGLKAFEITKGKVEGEFLKRAAPEALVQVAKEKLPSQVVEHLIDDSKVASSLTGLVVERAIQNLPEGLASKATPVVAKIAARITTDTGAMAPIPIVNVGLASAGLAQDGYGLATSIKEGKPISSALFFASGVLSAGQFATSLGVTAAEAGSATGIGAVVGVPLGFAIEAGNVGFGVAGVIVGSAAEISYASETSWLGTSK